MRKILMIVIIILLLGLGYVTLANGLKIGNLQILSVKQIEEESQKLKTKIEEVNSLIDVEYPKKISELKKANSNMKDSESEYFKYTNLSTDEEILEAMQKKNYTIEFLWATIGTHARNEGINLKFEIVSSSTGGNNANDLKFTAEGSYIAITNFVYALENDTNLNFKIENFKLLPHENEILQATFTVKNITIQGNTSNKTVTATKENNNETNTNQVDTNKTNTQEQNNTNTQENTTNTEQEATNTTNTTEQ